MVIRVPIEQGVVLVTSDNKDMAKHQAKSLSKWMKQSVRLRMQREYTPGVFALGWEAIQVARGITKMPKKKWVRR